MCDGLDAMEVVSLLPPYVNSVYDDADRGAVKVSAARNRENGREGGQGRHAVEDNIACGSGEQ